MQHSFQNGELEHQFTTKLAQKMAIYELGKAQAKEGWKEMGPDLSLNESHEEKCSHLI